jgi:hypothetical protein
MLCFERRSMAVDTLSEAYHLVADWLYRVAQLEGLWPWFATATVIRCVIVGAPWMMGMEISDDQAVFTALGS